MDELRVVAVDSSVVQHEVVFDEYVPFRVRSYSRPIGAGFVRLGDYSRTLLELAVEPHVQRLSGVTLTSLSGLEPWPVLRCGTSRTGTPIMGTSFSGYRVADLALQFKVAAGETGIVVFWDQLEDCEVLDCGRVKFLVSRGLLAGVLCTQVTQKERDLFHVASGSGQWR